MRSDLMPRLIFGALAEAVGLAVIFLFARRADGWNGPLLALGIGIAAVGTITAVITAFQIRQSGGS